MEIERAELVPSIETLRKARNNLRGYLKDKRKTVPAGTRSRKAVKTEGPSKGS